MQNTAAMRLENQLRRTGDARKAAVFRSFFKTAPGEYGYGDVFLGVGAADLRRIARQQREARLTDIAALLQSEAHEARLLALLVLIEQYRAGDGAQRNGVFRVYWKKRRFVNNWDLVDASAPHIVGAHLQNRSREPLYRLARSRRLWDRRIALVATLRFIRSGRYADTLALVGMLLDDREDLIHKAAGWMLREVGKRNRATEEAFLRTCYPRMPRTMLRYAVERFPEDLRRAYLEGTVPFHAAAP